MGGNFGQMWRDGRQQRFLAQVETLRAEAGEREHPIPPPPLKRGRRSKLAVSRPLRVAEPVESPKDKLDLRIGGAVWREERGLPPLEPHGLTGPVPLGGARGFPVGKNVVTLKFSETIFGSGIPSELAYDFILSLFRTHYANRSEGDEWAVWHSERSKTLAGGTEFWLGFSQATPALILYEVSRMLPAYESMELQNPVGHEMDSLLLAHDDGIEVFSLLR